MLICLKYIWLIKKRKGIRTTHEEYQVQTEYLQQFILLRKAHKKVTHEFWVQEANLITIIRPNPWYFRTYGLFDPISVFFNSWDAQFISWLIIALSLIIEIPYFLKILSSYTISTKYSYPSTNASYHINLLS